MSSSLGGGQCQSGGGERERERQRGEREGERREGGGGLVAGEVRRHVREQHITAVVPLATLREDERELAPHTVLGEITLRVCEGFRVYSGFGIACANTCDYKLGFDQDD